MADAWKQIADVLSNAGQRGKKRKIGIEIERIGIWPDCTPFRYEDAVTRAGKERPGAKTLLKELSQKYGWEQKLNPEGKPLGLKLEEGHGNISLEPGSQLELATIASEELQVLVERTHTFETQVDAITDKWGLRWIGLGVNPCNSVVDVDVIPLKRYQIMTDYLSKKGQLATSMMRLSSSVQINLDYADESEGIEMLQASLLGAPISYALFSNSPILRGKATGYLSYRRAIWERTDPDRTGLFHEATAKEFNFEKYARNVAARPLMFVANEDGQFVESEGCSLNDIAEGKLSGVSVSPQNVMTTLQQLFTEARIKAGYIEVRSVDGLRPVERYAAAALWMGILYYEPARKLVIDTFSKLNIEERETLLERSATEGIRAEIQGINYVESIEQIAKAAEAGLKERGLGEEKYLEPIWEILDSRKTPADRVLEVLNSVETRRVQTVIEHLATSGKLES